MLSVFDDGAQKFDGDGPAVEVPDRAAGEKNITKFHYCLRKNASG